MKIKTVVKMDKIGNIKSKNDNTYFVENSLYNYDECLKMIMIVLIAVN